MDCNQVQRHFNDFNSSQTSDSVVREIKQHLRDCTDCRVQQQRTARLQQLLAVKRYEKPSPEYFDGFLSEFHGRLKVEEQQAINLWQRIVDQFQWNYSPVSRFRYAGGFAILIAITSMWGGLQLMDAHNSSREPLVTQKSPQQNVATSFSVPTSHTPFPFENLDDNDGVRFAEFISQGPEEAITPDYVLDSILITPVNYEVDSVHF